jgi:hypothetical protein
MRAGIRRFRLLAVLCTVVPVPFRPGQHRGLRPACHLLIGGQTGGLWTVLRLE